MFDDARLGDRAIGPRLVDGRPGYRTARRRRLTLMRLMSDFREGMCGVVQQAISTVDEDVETYVATPIDRWLFRVPAGTSSGR